MEYPRLDQYSLRIVGYSDAVFAKNIELSSQLCRIVLLVDAAANAKILSVKSYKSRRVIWSVLAAEVIAFASLFDHAFTFRKQFEQALYRALPMHLMTDSKSLFDIVGKGSRTSEKRLMLDISAAGKRKRPKKSPILALFVLLITWQMVWQSPRCNGYCTTCYKLVAMK